ncbi:hypothetical protein FIU82_17940 (plasmid) [Pseudoalteromonas sp. THAF3]|uniref:DUF5675 family protein n=1 Tax=Pseudoalteromonas sp. THAF3 TaxID=2587843 RepID=UPI0012A88344|nr:DUF5675 family protein [Pseudoalteromonas sp. THAF3]QFU06879.1 hypothetical protein FIU82_17940 [Pseudoalteromonas sp. THAF3]
MILIAVIKQLSWPAGSFTSKRKREIYSSKRYPGVYELQGVPGRTKILIHAGNYHENTEGCLMPGKSWGVQADKHYYVGNSRKALSEIFSAISQSEQINVIITNEFDR